MISLLPTDGSTIEIEEWFHRLTLDVATEYLFGQSVNSLENPKVENNFSSSTYCRSLLLLLLQDFNRSIHVNF